MIKNLKIGNKLAILIISLTLTVVGIVSFLFYSQFRSALNERVLLQLNSIMKLKKGQIENQIAEQIQNVKNLSKAYSTDTINPDIISEVNFQNRIIRVKGKKDSRTFINKIPVAEQQDSVILHDLSSYNPDGTLLLGFQVKINDSTELFYLSEMLGIQQTLFERTGMGQTGESYLVGSDTTMRSRSRFFPDKEPTNISVRTKGVHQALNGIAGQSAFPDYRNVTVFSAYDKLDINGIDWVILSEIDKEEAEQPLRQVRSNLLLILVIVTAIVLILTYQLSQFIVKPVVTMEHELRQMAKGLIPLGKRKYKSDDEIGKMFEALDNLINTLHQAIGFADKIGSGDFNAQYSLVSDNDMLGQAMIRMREKLKEFKRNEAQLIKEKQKSLINGEEGERVRISKELHDGLGPLLTSLRMYIQNLNADEKEKDHLKSMLDETIKEVRRISNNLMPSVLLDFGVGEALRNLVTQVKSYTSVNVRYVNSVKHANKIPSDINIALYRIAQESLNNAIRHSEATEIKMSVTSFEDCINFFIADNGKGFDLDHHPKGSGLRNMKERAHLLNGVFHLETDQNGTKIEVEIPLT